MGIQHDSAGRPLPWPNPTTQPFFDGLKEGRLLVQRCARDGFFFYPRSRCPHCLADDWQWEETSGLGRIHAFTIDHVGHVPTLQGQAPYPVALVELDEGVRMAARITGADLERVEIGMRVRAAYETLEELTLLNFEPAPE